MAFEPPTAQTAKPAKRTAPGLNSGAAPAPVDVPAPGSQKSNERFALPRFLKNFYLEKTISNAFFFLLSLGALIFVVSSLANINSGAEFSSHAGLSTTVVYVFGAVSMVTFAVFAVRLLRSGTILVFPRISRTYRMLAKYGDPVQLLRECQESYGESRTRLKPREHILVKKFVIYTSSSSVVIAPVTELVRAFVAKVSDDLSGPGSATYEMELFFTKNVRISYRVSDKAEGIGELKWLKRYNQNMQIGFDPHPNRYELL